MMTAELNSLALLRFGGFRLGHGGGPGGFAWLLIGLAAVAIGIWAFSRTSERAPAKN
jgi:hypothetical protein